MSMMGHGLGRFGGRHNSLLDDTALSTPPMSFRETLAAAGRLAKPFFIGSPERKKAWLMVAGIAAGMAGQVALANQMNQIQGHMWEAFASRDRDLFFKSIGQSAVCLPLWAGLAWAQSLLPAMLNANWRNHTARRLHGEWIDHGAYYGLQRDKDGQDDAVKYAGQRLSDDVNEFIFKSIYTGSSFAQSVAMFFWFSNVLVHTGGWTPMLASIAISGAATALASKVGGNLSEMFNSQQKYRAEYRRSLQRTQEYAESIAMMGGEAAESKTMRQYLDFMLKNSFNIAQQNSSLSSFNSAFGQAAEIIPGLIMAPRLFAGRMTVDALKQGTGAYAYVDRALSWLVYSFNDFSSYRATVGRLSRFSEAIEDWNKKAADPASHSIRREILTKADGESTIVFDKVSLVAPDDGEMLTKPFDLTLRSGDRLVVTGESGAGKTTLMRAFSGLVDKGSGAIMVSAAGKILPVPQRTYLPLENLRGIVCYPDENPENFPDEEVRAALTKAGLGSHIKKMDDDSIRGNDWARHLSPGEQQRVAFARLFLHKPAVILLDEATSSLDPAGEADLYSKLIETCPRSIIISITHRDSVKQYHTMQADISDKTLTVTKLAPLAPKTISAPKASAP